MQGGGDDGEGVASACFGHVHDGLEVVREGEGHGGVGAEAEAGDAHHAGGCGGGANGGVGGDRRGRDGAGRTEGGGDSGVEQAEGGRGGQRGEGGGGAPVARREGAGGADEPRRNQSTSAVVRGESAVLAKEISSMNWAGVVRPPHKRAVPAHRVSTELTCWRSW